MDFESEKIQKIVDRSLEQFKAKPKLRALMESSSIQYDELESVFLQLYVLKDLDSVEGDALYKLGALVGEIFKNQTDEAYREAVRVRIFINSAASTINEILTLFENCQIIAGKTALRLRSKLANTKTQAQAADTFLQTIKGGGVTADYQYNSYDSDEHFQLDSSPCCSFVEEITLSTGMNLHFCSIINIGDSVWFVPGRGDYWIRYVKSSGNYATYEKTFSGSLSKGVYDETNSCIWGIPESCDNVVKFDLTSKIETLIAHGLPANGYQFSCGVLYENYLILVPFNANAFCVIHRSNETLDITKSYSGDDCKFKDAKIATRSGYLVCLPYNNDSVVFLDTDNWQLCEMYHGIPGVFLWQKLVEWQGDFFGIPFKSNSIIKIPNSGLYQIETPNQSLEHGGLVVLEAECAHTNTPQGGNSWVVTVDSGASNGYCMLSDPDIGSIRTADYVANSPRLDFDVYFKNSGLYYIWVRGKGTDAVGDSCHMGINGSGTSESTNIAIFSPLGSWVWSNTDAAASLRSLIVPSAGLHTINFWMREDGFSVDKIILTQDSSFVPTDLSIPNCKLEFYEIPDFDTDIDLMLDGDLLDWRSLSLTPKIHSVSPEFDIIDNQFRLPTQKNALDTFDLLSEGISESKIYELIDNKIKSMSHGLDLISPIFAGGNTDGKIYRSYDLGITWEMVYDSSSSGIDTLTHFANGIVLAGTHSSGILYRSIDFGDTWETALDSTESYINSSISFESGLALIGTYPTGKIYRSIDFGENWEVVYTSGEDGIYALTSFTGNEHIILACSRGTGKIFRSEDLGETWALAYDSPSSRFDSMCSFSNGIALAGAYPSGKIYKSIDFGENWVEIYDSSEAYILSLSCLDSGTAFAGTYPSGKIYKSIDFGENWVEIYDSSSSGIYSLVQLSESIVLAGSNDSGKIFRSENCGVSWNTVYDSASSSVEALSKTNLRSLNGCKIESLNRNKTLFAGGAVDGVIYRSDDLGGIWVEDFDTPASVVWDFIQCGNSMLAAAISGSRIFKKSLNTGWEEVVNFGEAAVQSLAVIGNRIVFAGVASTGKIYKSNDVGETWLEVYNSADTFISTLSALDDGTVIAGSGSLGQIYRSIDFGETWIIVKDTDETGIESSCFMPCGVAFIGTKYSGKILKSVNKGFIWRETYSSTYQIIKDFYVFSDSKVFAITETTDVLRSDNFGETWYVVGSCDFPPQRITGTSGLLFLTDSDGNISQSEDLGVTWKIIQSFKKLMYGIGVFDLIDTTKRNSVANFYDLGSKTSILKTSMSGISGHKLTNIFKE